MREETTPRKYMLSIEVEIRPQDDFTHFQPNTVVGHAPQFGVEWVGDEDVDTLENFFRFFVNWSHVKDPKEALKGVREIVQRALQEQREHT